MRTGPERKPRATREYQPTNRRVNKDHPPPPLHLLAAFEWQIYFAEKSKKKMLLPVDNFSAISTFQLSDPAPLILDCQPERYRRVRCIWFVGHLVISTKQYHSD